MLAALRKTAPNTTQFNILGAYFDDTSVERIRQWKNLYGDKDLGDEMVYGRDYEIRNGHPYFYRPWDVNDFLNRASFQQNIMYPFLEEGINILFWKLRLS